MAILNKYKLIILWIILTSLTNADRIKDVADILGFRENKLIGYGLVVGLNGTGDKSGQTFTEQSFRNMLVQLGINIPSGTKLDSKNIAAVMITSTLNPFAKKGQKLDVTVSSIGSAKSLRGGTLLMSPLKGIDGKVYAMAQGNLIVGGIGASGKDGSSVTINIPSVGRITGGATVEKTVTSNFINSKSVVFSLHRSDFTTARRMEDAINKVFGEGVAKALDAASVKVRAPVASDKKVSFLSVIENLEISPALGSAKIIINARTGTVVIGQRVTVRPAAVSHGSIIVTISENDKAQTNNAVINVQNNANTQNAANNPQVIAAENPPPISSSQVLIEQEDRRAFIFDKGANLREIVQTINAVGAAPGDLIAILEALKRVGALNAEIIVI